MTNEQYLIKLKEQMELKGNSPNSICIYTLCLKKFFEFLNDKPANDITTEDVKRFLLHQVNRGLDPSTINSKHSMILIFLKKFWKNLQSFYLFPISNASKNSLSF